MEGSIDLSDTVRKKGEGRAGKGDTGTGKGTTTIGSKDRRKEGWRLQIR